MEIVIALSFIYYAEVVESKYDSQKAESPTFYILFRWFFIICYITERKREGNYSLFSVEISMEMTFFTILVVQLLNDMYTINMKLRLLTIFIIIIS